MAADPGKQGKVYQIRIVATNREVLQRLPRERLDIGCTGGIRTLDDGRFALEAYAPAELVDELKRLQATVEVLGDAAEELARAQAQVGKGNRFVGKDRVPRGLGKKVPEGRVK